MAKAIPTNAVAVTPADAGRFSSPGTLFVGGYGDINVLLEDMEDSDDPADGLVFKGVSGDFPRSVKKVFATDTTAKDIILDQ